MYCSLTPKICEELMVAYEVRASLCYDSAYWQVFLDGEVDQAHNDRKMVDTSTGGRHQGEIRMIPLSCLMIVNYPTNSSTSNNGRWDMEVQRTYCC